MTRALLFSVMTAVAIAQAAAQTPESGTAAAPAAPAVSAPVADPMAGHGFAYDAGGRRDPFVSLATRGADAGQGTAAARVAGLAGLGAGEVTLRGTFQSEGRYIGIVQGADSKTYIVRAGAELADGTIRTITPEAMVILQHVNDPLSQQQQREVRKMLRQTEEAK